MTISNVNGANTVNPKLNAAPRAAQAQAPNANAPQLIADTLATNSPSNNGGKTDAQKLDEFIAANKQEFPEIEQAKLSLGQHVEAAVILAMLAGAVGYGSHELIRQLGDKKHAFIESKALSTDPVERKMVARDESVSLGTMMRLAADPDLSVRYALATRAKSKPGEFDQAVLEILAKDSHPMIRGLVASSDKLKAETVKTLAQDARSPQVRAAALGNSQLPKQDRQWLERVDKDKGGVYEVMMRIMGAKDTEANARQKLGFLRSNPNIGLSRPMMESLAKSEHPGVREALSRRPDLADDLIKQVYEHRSLTFFQWVKSFFTDPGLPQGKPNYEQDRVVLMSLAMNPNASAGMLTHMVENAKKDTSSNSSIRSRIDAEPDRRLGIPVTDADPSQYNTDIVVRAIVGNPRTDDTMRTMANASAYPYRYDEKTSMEAYLALNHANGLYLNGKYSEAASAYRKAIATTFHDSEQAYFELGQCLMAMKDVGGAKAAFIQALNINVNYSAAAEALDAINRPQGGR